LLLLLQLLLLLLVVTCYSIPFCSTNSVINVLAVHIVTLFAFYLP